MDNDDEMVGRILSRREVLRLFGVASMGVLVSCGTADTATTTTATTATPTINAEGQTAVALANDPTAIASAVAEVATVDATNTVIAATGCVVKPELTEGPYFLDERINRSDIRSDPATGAVKEGVPLQVTFSVSQIADGACTPLPNATVDVWHCDALGVYSDLSDMDTVDQKFLRGYQLTDASGEATFTSIYPGWYQGRAIHYHFKIRTDPDNDEGYEFTSQLFFDEALTTQILQQEPYATKGTTPDTVNSTDMHYANGGDQLLLALNEANGGYSGTFIIALDLSDAETGADDGFSMGGDGGPGANGGPPDGGPGQMPSTTVTN